MALLGEITLRFKRCHAACPSRSHSLPIDPVLHVARSEHARYARPRGSRCSLQVPIRVRLELTDEEVCERRMANGDKHGTCWHGETMACLDILDKNARHLVLSHVKHLFDDV